MKLEQMPRYPLLCGFTPLQRMENLEQALGCGFISARLPFFIKKPAPRSGLHEQPFQFRLVIFHKRTFQPLQEMCIRDSARSWTKRRRTAPPAW